MADENQKVVASLKLITKASIGVFLGVIASKLLTYLYRIITARYFGAEVYGIFSLAIMIIGLAIAIFSLGLPEGLIRYVSFYRGKKDHQSINYLTKNTLFILFLTSIMGAGVIFVSSRHLANLFNNPAVNLFLKILSILVPLTIISNALLAVLRAFEKIQWYSFISNVVGNGVRVLFIIAFLLLGFGEKALFASYILGSLSILIAAYAVYKHHIHKPQTPLPPPQQQKSLRKELHAYAWPLMFFTFLSTIFYWIDSFFLGYFEGVSAVGIYNAAVPIAFLLNFAPEMFLQLFLPLITKEFSRKNLTLIKELSKQIGKWIFIINIPFLVFTLLFPGALINLFFGEEYLPAVNALRILSAGTFIWAVFLVSSNLLSMAGKSKIILSNIIIASLLNILLNIILIPRYGMNGAAGATTLSFLLLSFLVMVEAKYYTNIIPLRRKLLRIFLVAIPPTLLLLGTRQLVEPTLLSMILQGCLFILFYFFLILIAGGLDKNDLAILSMLKISLKKSPKHENEYSPKNRENIESKNES